MTPMLASERIFRARALQALSPELKGLIKAACLPCRRCALVGNRQSEWSISMSRSTMARRRLSRVR
jgi:hypothetical protein